MIPRLHALWTLLLVVSVLTGCASTQTVTPIVSLSEPVLPRDKSSARPDVTRDTLGLVAYAASMQGKPYRSGGSSPTQGFDCSGLVQHVYSRFDFELPRNTTAMAEQLPSIQFAQLQAADLLFFDTQGARYSHVGIYLGDGRFVHAPSPRTGKVIISSISNPYWSDHLSGARRPSP